MPLPSFIFLISVAVQWLSCVGLFVAPRTAAHQASPSLTISWSLPKFMSIASVMLSSHLILWSPLHLPSIFPRIRDFSSESAVYIRWPKYWSFHFSISSFNEYSGLISLKIHWFQFPCCPRDSHESSPAPLLGSINSSLHLLYDPALHLAFLPRSTYLLILRL